MRHRIVSAIGLLWPATVLAASALDQAMASITPREWLATLLLSVFAGLVALFQRIKASQEAAVKRAMGEPYSPADIIGVSVWLYAVSHMSGAVLVGAVTFFSAQPVLTNGYAIAAAIAMASYGGARIAEKWGADKMAARADVGVKP